MFVHNPTRWLADFKAACAIRSTHAPRAEIIRQTQECLRAGQYPLHGTATTIVDMDAACKGTVRHVIGSTPPPPLGGLSAPPRVSVVAEDCVSAALTAKRMHSTEVAVLNMAAPQAPGCGPQGAQEENLHRRSNLKTGTAKRADLYPIPEDGCLFHPEVVFFRGPEAEGYPFVAQEKLSVVSVAACKLRRMETWTAEHEAQTEAKVRVVLSTAASHGVRVVVLSALGCGAFHNPPKSIATIFKTVIERDFPTAFDHIIFAILEDHNSRGVNGSTFSEVFGVELKTQL